MNRKKIHPLLPVLLWSVTVALAAEFVCMWIFVSSKQAFEHYNENWKLREVSECFHPDLWDQPWLSYRAGASVAYGGDGTESLATISGLGFRGADYGEASMPEALKIACFGGSTTVIGITDQQTYPALMEGFLNRNLNLPVSVLNAGVAGMDAGNYNRTLHRLKSQDALPDVVLEYNAINSICWQLVPYWKSKLPPWQRWIVKSQLVRYVFGRCFLPDEAQIREDLRDFCIAELLLLEHQLALEQRRLWVASFVSPDPMLGNSRQRAYLDFNARHWWRTDYISYRQLHRIIGYYNEELRLAFEGTAVTYLPLAELGDFGPNDFLDICHMRPEGTERMAYILHHLLLPILVQVRPATPS